MKQFGYSVLLLGASLCACSAAFADAESAFYATAIAGLGVLGSEDLSYRDEALDRSASADFDASFAGGATAGYRFNERWRVEGEVLYRRNDLNDVTLEGVGASTGGDYASLSFGLSALYDFRPFDDERLSLYAGAGVALIQEIDIDFEVDGDEISFETDDVGLQLQFGGRYDLSDALYVDVGVRYLTASGIEMAFPADTRRIVEADYAPVTVTAGLGWRF